MAVNRLSRMYSVTYKTFLLFLLALAWVSALVGCAPETLDPIINVAAYTYQPLNPTTVWIRDPTEKEKKGKGWFDGDETSYDFNKALLRDLDTETVRVALTTLDSDVDFNAGVVGTSVKGKSYVLIVDYIKYLTSSMDVNSVYTSTNAKGKDVKKPFRATVPMYTGIGLRVRAEFKALKGELNISGLPAIAFAASTEGISGRLTVQTLGITGSEVTGLMPIISDISITSIQNAVQAVGAIKAKIYEKSTTIYPKIVAFESPERDPAIIRAITEELYASKEYICPIVSKHPQDVNDTVFWIKWFSPPPDDDDDDEDDDDDAEDDDDQEDEPE